MKVALVHDWLIRLGGAERVLIELHRLFPQAPVYTLFHDKKFTDQFLPAATIRTSGLQSVPGITRLYKFFFPFMPSAVEGFDLSAFDLVISSSVFFAKGVVVKPKTRHISYCYSPSRSLWDRNIEYENREWPSLVSRHFLRLWDRHAADRVDAFVAISDTVKERIHKYYNRDSTVIYPPAPKLVTRNLKLEISGHYYLIVSRLYPHKNVDIAVDAFNKLGYNLIIIGEGPACKGLERTAKKNIRFLGYQNDTAIAAYYQQCKAFIMPQEEDFGLTPIEAMGFGKPVLALRKGGATETIIEGVTGEFFDDPIPEALADGVKRLNQNYAAYEPRTISAHAEKFSREQFTAKILSLINDETLTHHRQL